MPNSSSREAGDFNANYADELPPKWISTTKVEYVKKPLSQHMGDTEQSRELSKYTRQSHFSLEGHDDPGTPLSLTKKDYCGKDPKSASREDYREFLKTYHMYPPVFRDETQLRIQRGEDPVERKPRIVPQSRFERKLMIDSGRASKGVTHFSLGDDSAPWETLTRSAMKPHKLTAKPPPSEYETLERSKSTVLDYPDLELEPMQSVQKRGKLKDDLDRSTLIVDNTNSIKDLKSTHFTLGSDSSSCQLSQYGSTFGESAAKCTEAAYGHQKAQVLARPASKFCIIAEDFEDRRMGGSSQREDFKNPNASFGGAEEQIRLKAIKVRQDERAEGVTKSDYGRPCDQPDGISAIQAYERRGHIDRQRAPFYDPINVEKATMDTVSTTHSQFRNPSELHGKQAALPAAGGLLQGDNVAYLKSSHFEIGSDDDRSTVDDRLQSTTKRHFVDPQALIHTVRKDGAGSSGLNGGSSFSRDGERFAETLSNTVTRPQLRQSRSESLKQFV
eukprot:jgi/Hompol1/3339/HPOL_001578-RA